MFRTVNTSRLVASFPITLSDRHSLLKRQSRSYYVRNRWRVLMDMKRLPCRALNELGCHEKRSITDWSNSSFGESLVADRVVGILGGGQLGRMAALAAANLGVKVKCLDPTPNAPASVAAEQVIGDFKDPEAILNFAKGCDVLTVEIEHVDVEALRKVSKKYGIPVQPSPDALEIIQDKYLQKMHFRRHGLPVGSAVEVNAYKSLQAVCEQGFPVMLKSRRLAYDGRGNFVINSMQDIQSGVDALGGYGSQLYVEQWVQFKKELAVMVARSVDGTVLSYPVVETIHKNSICFVTEAPADVDNSILTKAQKVAEEAVKCLKGAGIFGVEMFLLDDGEVLINEVAPRPHNSGHYTIDACSTSQFEQHIRAILGWPLGDPSLIVKNAIMLNILGEESGKHGLIQAQNMIQRALSIPGAKAHWYEKTDVKKNRKVGHINIIGSSREESRNRLKLLSHEANTMLTSTSSSEADSNSNAQVSVIMGSDSDLVTMKAAADVLEEFGIPTEVTIVSAHRTPERMMNFAKTAHERGIKVIIAGAGGAAHLPGMVAAMTPLPVIGVPCVPSGSHLDGIDSLLSIVQMPKGVPVATVAIGNAANAGLLAVRILSAGDKLLQESMIKYQKRMANMVMDKVDRLERNGLK